MNRDDNIRQEDIGEKDHIEELLEEDEIDREHTEISEEDELEKLKKEVADLKNKLLKQAADNDNFRKRIIKETDDKIKYANQSLVSKFLPVLDNFDLALIHSGVSDIQSVLEGVSLTRKVMLDTLEKSADVKLIETKPGDVFNPEIHEAVAICNNPDMNDNTIAAVLQQGYTMHGRVIRSVKVQVNKK